jgi:branched-chain amino acid transport system permease protein
MMIDSLVRTRPRVGRPSTGFPTRRVAAAPAFGVAAVGVGLLLDVQWQASLILALLACMGALALNLLLGTAGQVSIGNAGMLAVGAFGAVWFTELGLPFPVDVLCAAGAAGLVGLVVGLPALRLRGLYLAIATLAAHFVILFACLQYQNAAAGPAGFILAPVVPGRLREAQATWVVVVAVVLVATMLLVGMLQSGATGRTWRMIRDHEEAAPTLGIRVTRWKLAAFVVSSTIVGAQGALLAHFSGVVTVESFTLGVAITYVAMVVVGSLDSVAGAVAGAILVALLPTVVPELVTLVLGASAPPTVGATLSAVVYGALILVFVVLLPQGIVGGLRGLRARVRRDG